MCALTSFLNEKDLVREVQVYGAVLKASSEVICTRCVENNEFILEQEGLLEIAIHDIQKCVAKNRALHGAKAMLRKHLRACQDDCAVMRRTHRSATSELVLHRNTAMQEAQQNRTKLQQVMEKTKLLEADLEIANGALSRVKRDFDLKVQNITEILNSSVTSLQKDIARAENKLVITESKQKEEMSRMVLRLREAEKTGALKASQNNELEEQLNALRQTLSEEKLACTNAIKASSQAQAALRKMEVKLKTEVGAREESQRELDLARQHWELNRETLEKVGESLQRRLRTAQTTKVSFEHPRKRDLDKSHLTMQDLERSAKRPRQKTPPKTSEFSLTPHLRRQTHLFAKLDAPVADSKMAGDYDNKPDEKSILVPSVIESNNPTRLLLVGAARESENVVVPEVGVRCDTRQKAENEDTVEKIIEEELGNNEENSLLFVAPQTNEAVLDLFDDPCMSKMENHKRFDQNHSKRRKRHDFDKAFVGGIRPTIFDDDGTGRIHVQFDDVSQEARRLPSGTNPLRSKSASRAHLPSESAFVKEISPAKNRPEALKKFGFKK